MILIAEYSAVQAQIYRVNAIHNHRLSSEPVFIALHSGLIGRDIFDAKTLGLAYATS